MQHLSSFNILLGLCALMIAGINMIVNILIDFMFN